MPYVQKSGSILQLKRYAGQNWIQPNISWIMSINCGNHQPFSVSSISSSAIIHFYSLIFRIQWQGVLQTRKCFYSCPFIHLQQYRGNILYMYFIDLQYTKQNFLLIQEMVSTTVHILFHVHSNNRKYYWPFWIQLNLFSDGKSQKSFPEIDVNFHWIHWISWIQQTWWITEVWIGVNLKMLSVTRELCGWAIKLCLLHKRSPDQILNFRIASKILCHRIQYKSISEISSILLPCYAILN